MTTETNLAPPGAVTVCQECGKACNAAGAHLPEQPAPTELFRLLRENSLQSTVCQQCQTNPPAPAPAPARAITAAAVHRQPCRQKTRQKPATREPIPARGCPEEREFTYTQPVHEMSAAAYHEEFIKSVECKESERRVLVFLMKGFNGTEGQWHTGVDIQKECNIEAMSACAARIRAKLKPTGLYFDSRVMPGGPRNHWQYRICNIEVAEAIKREENGKKDKNQSEFQPGARN